MENRPAPPGILKEHNLSFDLEAALKDALVFGLAIGLVSAVGFLLWAYGSYLAAPKVTAAAAVKNPCGFQLPD